MITCRASRARNYSRFNYIKSTANVFKFSRRQRLRKRDWELFKGNETNLLFSRISYQLHSNSETTTKRLLGLKSVFVVVPVYELHDFVWFHLFAYRVSVHFVNFWWKKEGRKKEAKKFKFTILKSRRRWETERKIKPTPSRTKCQFYKFTIKFYFSAFWRFLLNHQRA